MTLTKIIEYGSYFLAGTYLTKCLYNLFVKPKNKGRIFKYNTEVDIESTNNRYGGNIEDDIEKSKYTFIFTIDDDSIHHIKNFVNFILLNLKGTDKILIKINSAGGSSCLFFNALTQLKRLKGKYDLTIFIESMACSGGYLVASIGDKIYTTENATIGSIGVYTESYKIDDLLQSIGIDGKMIFAGENKVIGSMIGKEQKKKIMRLKKKLIKFMKNSKKWFLIIVKKLKILMLFQQEIHLMD